LESTTIGCETLVGLGSYQCKQQ